VGLITGLLTLPLAPIRGTVWLAEQLAEVAEAELYDEDKIRRQLVELDMLESDGLIDADERTMREDEILARLSTARRRNAATPPG
jgi:Gas vesicle protein G